jgi:uncharacterized membrane protein
MISNHYPLAHTGAVLPVLVALITFAGAIIRHFFNGWHADHAKAPWWCWIAALLALGAAMALSWQAAPGRQSWLEAERQMAAASPAMAEQAIQIVQGRCSMCHAEQPVWDGISAPPKGVKLAEEADIRREAKAIGLHAVLTHAMPPNNITEITPEERAALALWLTRR